MNTFDTAIRRAAFSWLAKTTDSETGMITWSQLQQGFPFNDTRLPIAQVRGIFKPKVMDYPLSIRTSPRDPYGDSFEGKDVLLYRYFGQDPDHPDNVGLRQAMKLRLPLVYLKGISKGNYYAAWPVYIVGDDPANLRFRVVADLPYAYSFDEARENSQARDIRRGYATSQVQVRLHQQSFRDAVMRAYRRSCAFCALKHEELLDAAHIIADSDPSGVPKVTNGLALCKIHHAAFDKRILGVTPDFQIQVQEAVLDEEDGPMLKWGLQEMNGRKLHLPRHPEEWPDRKSLEKRYEEFLKAG